MTSVIIGIVILNGAILLVLIFVFALLWQAQREWRFQHRLRTPAASLYGMVRVLAEQSVELPFETRMKLYKIMEQDARALLNSLDIGEALLHRDVRRGDVETSWTGDSPE